MRLIEFTKIADILAKTYKIMVLEGQSWSCNIETKNVFYRKEDIITLPEEHILGLLLHEIAHIHYTTETTIKPPQPGIKTAILNMVEDHVIESIISKDYPNAGEILNSTVTELINKLLKILPTLTITEHERALLYASCKFVNRGFMFNKNPYQKTGNEIAELMIKRKNEIFQRKKTKDLLPLTEDILKILNDNLGTLSQLQDSRILEEESNHTKAHSCSSQSNTKKALIKSMKKGKYGLDGDAPTTLYKPISEIIDNISTIGIQLRSILKINNAKTFGGRFRSGKTLTKRLIRSKTIKDNRIFAKEIIKNNKKYSFAIMADVSGSMNDACLKNYEKPVNYALSSLLMVATALKIAKIPRKLYLFAIETEEINQSTTTNINWEEIANQRLIKRTRTGGTYIETAINEGVNFLKQENTEKKILILLTDGDSNEYEIEKAYQKAKKENIECLAIIINRQNSALQEILPPKNVFLIPQESNGQDIGQAFITILKETVKQSTI